MTVEEIKKLNSNVFKNGLRNYVKNGNLNHGIQSKHTPYDFCKDVILQLQIADKKICVLFNTEFVDVLINDFNVKPENIYFLTDSDVKLRWVETHYLKDSKNLFLIDAIKLVKKKKFISKKGNAMDPVKFDVVIGNPPYKGNLHLSLLKVALDSTKQDGKVIFVHPSTWLFMGNKGDKTQPIYNDVKKSIEKYQKTFTFFNGNSVFGIDMFMPCSITYINKAVKDEKANVIDKINGKQFTYNNIYLINKWGDIPEYYSLLRKIINNTEESLEEHKETTEKGKRGKKHNHYVNLAMIRGNVGDKNTMFTDDFYTFIPRALKSSDKKEKVLFFGFENEKNAIKFIDYLQTKFARFCLALVKCNSQLARGEMCLVPWLDFSKKYSDSDLKTAFNITDKEWKFIESVIPNYY